MAKTKQNKPLALNLLNLKVHANSPYNDGWTQEMYREMYEKERKKLEKQNKKNVKDRSK